MTLGLEKGATGVFAENFTRRIAVSTIDTALVVAFSTFSRHRIPSRQQSRRTAKHRRRAAKLQY